MLERVIELTLSKIKFTRNLAEEDTTLHKSREIVKLWNSGKMVVICIYAVPAISRPRRFNVPRIRLLRQIVIDWPSHEADDQFAAKLESMIKILPNTISEHVQIFRKLPKTNF